MYIAEMKGDLKSYGLLQDCIHQKKINGIIEIGLLSI